MNRGFSLIELVITVVILGVLSSLCMIKLGNISSVTSERALINKALLINAAKISLKYEEPDLVEKFNFSGESEKYTMIQKYLSTKINTLGEYVGRGNSVKIGNIEDNAEVSIGKKEVIY